MQYRTKQTFKIYWEHAKTRFFLMLAILSSMTVAGILNIIIPLYFKDFFDVLASTDKIFASGILFKILLVIALLEIIKWSFGRIALFGVVFFESKIIADLSNVCFEYLHKHSFSYFNNNFVGSLVKKVNRFTRSFESLFDNFIFRFMPLVVNIVAIIVVLLWRNQVIGLGIIVWIVLFLIINWIFTRYKLKYDVERSAADSRSTALLADTITNNANVKLFGGYAKEVKDFAFITEKVRKLRAYTWGMSTAFESVQTLLVIGLEIGVFYYAIFLWKKGLFTAGDFVLLQTYVVTILLRIGDFGKVIQRSYEDLAEAEEMTEVLNTPHEIIDAPKAKKLKVTQGEVEFKKVSFEYADSKKVFSNLNLKIFSKQKVALVGPSGAGKTTIVKMLLRMYGIKNGAIEIDGQDIAKVTQESLWKNVSMVPQDPILFHRSLMENIRYGREEATDKEVITAAKLAYCHDFIKNLPDGYNTFVGERGVKLSGGERQRVAIARAILHNAPILVLDEATSSLDSESEHLIQAAMNSLMENKTVIVIAHRLSTIMKMDRILVIERGRVEEDGTHTGLLAKKDGIYNKLWNLQAGGFIQ